MIVLPVDTDVSVVVKGKKVCFKLQVEQSLLLTVVINKHQDTLDSNGIFGIRMEARGIQMSQMHLVHFKREL